MSEAADRNMSPYSSNGSNIHLYTNSAALAFKNDLIFLNCFSLLDTVAMTLFTCRM